MAIIIPSKNIYEPEVSKINDNFFTKIDATVTHIEDKIQFGDAVHNYEGAIGVKTVFENEKKSGTFVLDSGTLGFRTDYAYMNNEVKRYEVEVTVPILQKNKYILKLLDNPDEIAYTVSGYYSRGTASAEVTWARENSYIGDITTIENEKDSSFQSNLNIPEEQVVFSHPFNSVKIYGVENLKPIVEVKKSNSLDAYIIKINMVVAFDITALVASTVRIAETSSQASGTFETFNGTNISITIEANTMGIDISKKTVTINNEGITSAKVKSISVEENELIQTNSGYLSPNGLANDIVYKEALTRYIGGLETMTIRCPIANYYKSENDYTAVATDELAITPYYGIKGYDTVPTFMLDASEFSQNHVLSENGEADAKIPIYLPMTFQLHDVVMPMSYNKWNADIQQWEDQPRSYTQSGDPKLFEVVGIQYVSGGSTWQILNLIEFQNSARIT